MQKRIGFCEEGCSIHPQILAFPCGNSRFFLPFSRNHVILNAKHIFFFQISGIFPALFIQVLTGSKSQKKSDSSLFLK